MIQRLIQKFFDFLIRCFLKRIFIIKTIFSSFRIQLFLLKNLKTFLNLLFFRFHQTMLFLLKKFLIIISIITFFITIYKRYVKICD